jgi:hypothetical protein
VDLLGGYSRNQVSDETLTPGVDFRPSSGTVSGNVILNYSLGNTDRGLDVTGGGRANTYSGFSGGSRPIYGATARVGARTTLGRSSSLSASQSLSRDPYIALGVFGNNTGLGSGLLYDPEGNPVNGVIDGNTTLMVSNVTATHGWSRRLSSTTSYAYTARDYDGQSPFSYGDHSGRVSLGAQVGRRSSVDLGYSLSSRDTSLAINDNNYLVHGLTGGFSVDRPLSPSRSLSFAVGGGGEYVDGDLRDYWSPTFYGSVAIDLGRSWNLSGTYNQASSVLRSPSVVPDSYLTRSGVISAGGYVNTITELVFIGAVTRGTVSSANSFSGTQGSFTGYTGNAQLRVALTSWWSTVVSLNQYWSELGGAALGGAQGSGTFETTTLRVGFSWTVPLYTPRS